MVTKIVVIGMGYVGIPAAALLADVDGYDVTGLQRRSKRSGWKIDILNSGKSPFEGDEPGLDELITKVVKKGTFRVTDDIDILKDADIILIDVQTPTDSQNMPRYESLREVSANIGQQIKKGAIVIVESTVAPGTTQNVVQKIIEKESGMKGGVDF
ncbi:MAG: nucleotide sugar dehydrogenase, partial [Candidatus Thorarchaeota archaeon]